MTKKLIFLDPDTSDLDDKESEDRELNQIDNVLKSSEISSSCSVKINESEPYLPEWECVMSIKREMSWGLATVHL